MKATHPGEDILALYASRDLEFLDRVQVALHVRGCKTCRQHVDNHQAIRADLAQLNKGPAGDFNWDRLSDEMTANIRLGLTMAECAGPGRHQKSHHALNSVWRPVAITMGAGALMTGAFILNMPMDRVAKIFGARDHSGTVLEATASGIEMRHDGTPVITVRHPDRKASHEVAANLDGSMSTRDVDDETGQVTIINVSGQ